LDGSLHAFTMILNAQPSPPRHLSHSFRRVCYERHIHIGFWHKAEQIDRLDVDVCVGPGACWFCR
jgi:hypothetical protein